MLGPLLFDNRGAIVRIFVLQKRNSKKAIFAKKNFLLNMNLKNVVKQKRCTRVILLGAENFKKKKIKIEGVAFI